MNNFEKYFNTPEKLISHPIILESLCAYTDNPRLYIYDCSSCIYHGYDGCVLKNQKQAALKWLTGGTDQQEILETKSSVLVLAIVAVWSFLLGIVATLITQAVFQ